MSDEFDWESFLNGHPIFSRTSGTTVSEAPLLSTKSWRVQKSLKDKNAGMNTRGRQLMCMKDSHLIVAVGNEIRITSLSDAKISGGSQKWYKTLHTPDITFEIRQITLNPTKKLLVVAGSHQVVVVVLPRAGFSMPETVGIDCKSIQIGPNYHSIPSPPIVKVNWHPWGEAGATLLVMSLDGRLREYDVSIDPDEPQDTLNFVSQKKKRSFGLFNDAEREVASFTFGKGEADWGPLTLYAVMKSGHVYAMCPYLPVNASVPFSYLRALECFVASKEEFVGENNGKVDESFSSLYSYQRKYVNSLLKHLEAVNSFPSTHRSVSVQSPKVLPGPPSRQGPFLLQPAPPELENSPGGEATDVAYVTLGIAFTEPDGRKEDEAASLASERLGVLLVGYQDGKVEVYLDLEKVEARWDTTNTAALAISRPSLTSYEAIDLGIVRALASGSGNRGSEALELIEANQVTFYLDPIHDDTVYAYHAFGVHILNLNAIFQNLAAAMKEENENTLQSTVQSSSNSIVGAVLSTYSAERQTTAPVAGVVVPGDVYLTYSLFILTSAMRVVTSSLNLRTESIDDVEGAENSQLSVVPAASGNLHHPSLLQSEPFPSMPVLSSIAFKSTVIEIPSPKPDVMNHELRLTPETLRYLTDVVERLANQIHKILAECTGLKHRIDLQLMEYSQLLRATGNLAERSRTTLGARKTRLEQRLKTVQDEQIRLSARVDRLLYVLIRRTSPEINEHEKRWFEELQRMKAQVLGIGRFDPDSLKMRTHQLQTEFERLLPALEALSPKEAGRKARSEEGCNGAGHSYVKAYQELAKLESKRVENAIAEITKLAKKLDITNLGPSAT